MARGILEVNTSCQAPVENAHAAESLHLTGVLENFDYEDVTPIIGREFPTLNVVDDLINAQNSDELLRELAITSMYLVSLVDTELTSVKSLAAVLSSSARRTISPTICKSSL
jgi:hypothetical protein